MEDSRCARCGEEVPNYCVECYDKVQDRVMALEAELEQEREDFHKEVK